MSTPTLAPGGTVPASAGQLTLRGLRLIRRQPSTFIPALLMPIFQTIAFSGTFYAVTEIPGFPTDRSINWYMPLAACMGAAFSGVNNGFTAIRDLESGFFDRLRMAPTPRWALVLGPTTSAMIRALIVVTTVLVIALIGRATLPGGVLGIVTLYAAALGVAVIGSGWGLGLAYRLRDMRATAIMQLTLFLAVFLSTAQTPLTIMEGWLEPVARVNPATQILRLAREGFLGEVTWGDTWPGLVAAAVLGALALWFARRGLERLDDI